MSSYKIKVIGVGGGGCNAVNRMIESGINRVDFIAINTDSKSLEYSKSPVKLLIGENLTNGMGAGANPMLGREAATADSKKIIDALNGADMVFVLAGLGGGTGTGAAPVIASIAKKLDILTIGIVTKPFTIEGTKRLQQAEQGLKKLRGFADTVITIPNSSFFPYAESKSIVDFFQQRHNYIRKIVDGITEVLYTPGIINFDIGDISPLLKNDGGSFLVGVGEFSGERAVIHAMNMAIEMVQLGECSLKNSTNILTYVNCPKNTSLTQIEEALEMLIDHSNEKTNIEFGTSYNNSENNIKVVLLGTDNSDS